MLHRSLRAVATTVWQTAVAAAKQFLRRRHFALAARQRDEPIPRMPEPRLRPLMERFGEIVIENRALAQTFSVVGSVSVWHGEVARRNWELAKPRSPRPGITGPTLDFLDASLPYATRRNFTLFILARGLGAFARQMLGVAVGWHVYSAIHSAMSIAYIGLAEFLRLLLLSPERSGFRSLRSPNRFRLWRRSPKPRHVDLRSSRFCRGGLAGPSKQPTSADGAPLWMKMMTARTCVSCIALQPAILFSWQRFFE